MPPISVRGLEARLLHGIERFFVESGAAAFGDLRFGYFAFSIDFDRKSNIAF
jgi:hypothetical protein